MKRSEKAKDILGYIAKEIKKDHNLALDFGKQRNFSFDNSPFL